MTERLYFHGTDHEFQPDDIVLPGNVVGKNSGYSQRDDRGKVFVFTAYSCDDARQKHGNWAYTSKKYIYRVQPQGPIEPDPADRFSGDKWCCGSAKVLKQVWPKA